MQVPDLSSMWQTPSATAIASIETSTRDHYPISLFERFAITVSNVVQPVPHACPLSISKSPRIKECTSIVYWTTSHLEQRGSFSQVANHFIRSVGFTGESGFSDRGPISRYSFYYVPVAFDLAFELFVQFSD